MTAKALLAAVSLTTLFAGAAHADEDFAAAFQAHLAAADISGAEALAQSRLSSDPADAQAGFALGAAQFLGAIEGLGQDLYRHGLWQPPHSGALDIGITSLPFLRFPVPHNPDPAPFTAEVFRQMLADLDSGLARSAETLAAVPSVPVSLPMDVYAIHLDLNGDGAAGADEGLASVLEAVTYLDTSAPLGTLAFDQSDLPWLEGYAHLLQGVTGILLAHDLTDTVNQTFSLAFPESSDLSSAPLAASLRAALERAQTMQRAGDCDYDKVQGLLFDETYTPRDPATLSDDQRKTVAAYESCTDLRDLVGFAGIGDLIAFVHLMHWPVVDPDRLKASRQHFLKMIALSRESWSLILAETDNDREWLPNPRQTGPFPTLRVTDQTVAGWMDFLDQAEGVLEGRLLIPHWRWDSSHGLNIARMFEEPHPLDPVLLIAGVGAIPFIEEGPLAPGSTMDTAMRMMDGGPLAYFLWFN